MSPYERFAIRGAWVVARAEHAAALREMLSEGTLFGWAASQSVAEPLRGRGVAWGVVLPDGARAVVRHSRHGGVFAPLTRDLFLAPTRAPRELAAAQQLAERGVPTPEVIAYAVYPVWGPLCRADVVTARLAGSDFPAAWSAAREDEAREQLTDALAALLNGLRAAGAHHPDLNLKNVFIVNRDGAATACVLDVDRVRFEAPGSARVAAHNLLRLVRSIRSWRVDHGLDLRSTDLARLAAALDLQGCFDSLAAMEEAVGIRARRHG